MDTYKNQFINFASKIDRRHVQIALIVLALSLFVLSAGAPGAPGDFRLIQLIGH